MTSVENDANQLAAKAVEYEDIGGLASAIAQGADPNAVNRITGDSLLHAAVQKNNPVLVAVLLQLGAHVDSKSGAGETALYRAAESNFHGVMIILLEHGALPDLPNERGDSALHQAAKYDNHDAVATLLSRGASPNILNAQTGNSPLHEAASSNRLRVAEDLLRAGASIERKNLQGNTALDLAIREQADRMVQLLNEWTRRAGGTTI